MPRPKIKNKRVITANLNGSEYDLLDRIATKERRTLSEVIRIIIPEAAEARGIKVEQEAQS
jgi:hypothetical protein